MLGIQLLITLFALFAVVRTIRQFRAGRLSALWGAVWLLFWIVVVVLVFLPNTTQILADVLGVGRGADLVIYVALVALFYLQFKLFVKIESVEQEVSTLVRKIALDDEEGS